MMNTWEKLTGQTTLLPSEAYWKQQRNIEYLMELKEENLLFPYYWESGLSGNINKKLPDLHGGWDSQNSHIRGTFTAHWLSAAAYLTAEVPNPRLKAKMDYIVDEIRRCQIENGGKWGFPIPPKYIYGVKEGKYYWAPLYVCHKVLMGLFDVYKLTNNQIALDIITGCGEWFVDFTASVTKQELADMMDRQETGGLMEIWGDLYQATQNECYLTLMRQYERTVLFDALFEGKDVLTNMHANSTIPEIHGAAKAYEITGEQRYRIIVENYWELAVTRRGMFATGSQTCGEVWTPINRQSARLGDQNQEHCVVYNMIRLADYLYKWTGDVIYGDYIERNILNGIFAQGFWEGNSRDMVCEPTIPDRGLVTYYLPLHSGGQKKWGSATEHFWCCHCTLIQANSRLREFIYYSKENHIAVSQYLPSRLETAIDAAKITITQSQTDLGGSCNKINDIALKGTQRPDFWSIDFEIKSDSPVRFSLDLRIPWWIAGKPECIINDEQISVPIENGYISLERSWHNDKIQLILPKKLSCWPLADEPETVAFLDGPVVLAGIVPNEVMLYGDIEHPEDFIKPHCERVWSMWTQDYKTFNQPFGFYLKPLNQIGREQYSVYFPVRKSVL